MKRVSLDEAHCCSIAAVAVGSYRTSRTWPSHSVLQLHETSANSLRLRFWTSRSRSTRRSAEPDSPEQLPDLDNGSRLSSRTSQSSATLQLRRHLSRLAWPSGITRPRLSSSITTPYPLSPHRPFKLFASSPLAVKLQGHWLPLANAQSRQHFSM